MRRIRHRLPTLLAVFALGLAAAPAAQANSFETIFKDYAKTGKVSACKYTSKQLKDAKRQVPNDIDQYAPDFPAALDAALQQRSSGACAKKSGGADQQAQNPTGGGTGGAPTTTQGAPATSTPAPAATTPAATTSTPAGVTPAPAPSVDPAPAANDDAIPAAAISRGDSGSDAPAPLLLLAIFGGLMLLGAFFYALTRYWALDPGWLQRARHSTAEAGWRASAAWAEFRDWLRFGR